MIKQVSIFAIPEEVKDIQIFLVKPLEKKSELTKVFVEIYLCKNFIFRKCEKPHLFKTVHKT